MRRIRSSAERRLHEEDSDALIGLPALVALASAASAAPSTNPALNGDTVAFSFVDVTGLPSPDAAHMHKLVVKFQDADHFTQEWTHRKAGKDETGVFKYARKK